MIKQHSWRRYGLWLVLLLSLTLKVALWWHVVNTTPTSLLRVDSAAYIDSARALWQQGRFAVSPEQPAEPMTFRTPGYPAFLALIFALSGRAEPTVSALVQLLLSLGTIGVVYWLGRRLWSQTIGLLAATLLALDIPSLAYSLFIMSETLFTLLLLSALAVLGAHLAPSSPLAQPAVSPARGALLASSLLALTTLTRPITYYLIVPISLLCLWIGWRSGWSRRTLLFYAVCLTLPFVLLIGGWQMRNYLLTGDSAFSTVTPSSLFLYRGAGVVALRDGVSLEAAQAQLRPELAGLATVQARNAYMTQRGLALIRQYPLLAVRTQVAGALTMLLGLGDGWLTALVYATPDAISAAWALLHPPWRDVLTRWMSVQPVTFGAFWLAAIHLLIVYGGIAIWLIQILRTRKFGGWVQLLLWVVVLYLVVISAGPEANSRFRVPLMPILALYAARGINYAK